MSDDQFIRYTKRDAEATGAMIREFARIERIERRARIVRVVLSIIFLLSLGIVWRLS